jgi:hypothetical protein
MTYVQQPTTRRRIRRHLGRFARSQSGSATVEFVVAFPALIAMMLFSAELAIVNFNDTMLERAVDMTVRDIRLGTGTAPQHDTIKQSICDRAAFISDCSANLRLEMVRVDPRNWTGIPADADCIDTTQPVTPVRNFINGQENDLMVLRACVRIDPLFPTSGLGKKLAEGAGGKYALIATSAFVQEPR